MSLADAVRAQLPASPEGPGLAREKVREALAMFNLKYLEDEATLIVSEIATNAVIHGEAPIRLCVYVDEGLLFIEVEDGGGEQVPRMRHAGPDAVSGRGLEIVEAIAADWDVEQVGGGVRVWASLSIEPESETGPGGCDCPCGYAEEPAAPVMAEAG